MKKQAIIFLDYNETFDDIRYGKGKIFMTYLSNFIRRFDGNVQIVVVTAAPYGNPNFSIRDDFKGTMNFINGSLKNKFRYLIEHNCEYLTPINFSGPVIEFGNTAKISSNNGSKKDGVEIFLQKIDPNEEIDTCVFAGNSEESDLIMMDADLGNRKKYFLLANRRLFKSDKYPVYKLSMQKQEHTYNYGKDIFEQVQKQDALIIQTGTKSYGLGKGFQALTSYLNEKDNSL